MKNFIIEPSISIKDCLLKLEEVKEKCLIIARKNNRLLGTLNDGDIRRAIISGANVDSSIQKYIQKKPFFLSSEKVEKLENFQLLKILEQKKNMHIDVIPVIDKKKIIKNLITLKTLKQKESYTDRFLNKIPLVIMAGGKGTRLKPFTNIFPKPLIPIDNLPAVQHIIRYFNKSGINKIFLTLNYKKKLIKSYFEDDKNIKLRYIEEKKSLGSAGSIGLLKNKIKTDFFVCNCDTIAKVNLHKIYEYHLKGKFYITLVVAAKKHDFPYGSCELDKKGNLKKIIEKPHKNHLANIGFYLMSRNVIKLLFKTKTIDMDQLIKLVKKKKKKIGVFPISDKNWLDVGEWSEYNKVVFQSQK